MIKIENVETFGWEAAIRGMRNPMNSWNKSDSFYCYPDGAKLPCDRCMNYNEKLDECMMNGLDEKFIIGECDLKLMKNLVKAGSDHRKFMRMINVTLDIAAPLYWWKEFDTYKVGTVADSCSTMHKIADKEFTFDDFSCEHLLPIELQCLGKVIELLNENRKIFNAGNGKDFWWQMIQMLPSSYNQKRTVQLNYEVLRNMYHARKNHKLDEWKTYCEWIETLPYANELIVGVDA